MTIRSCRKRPRASFKTMLASQVLNFDSLRNPAAPCKPSSRLPAPHPRHLRRCAAARTQQSRDFFRRDESSYETARARRTRMRAIIVCLTTGCFVRSLLLKPRANPTPNYIQVAALPVLMMLNVQGKLQAGRKIILNTIFKIGVTSFGHGSPIPQRARTGS